MAVQLAATLGSHPCGPAS